MKILTNVGQTTIFHTYNVSSNRDAYRNIKEVMNYYGIYYEEYHRNSHAFMAAFEIHLRGEDDMEKRVYVLKALSKFV